MAFFSEHWPRASYLFRELLARAISSLVRYLYLNFILGLKVYKTIVLINVTLFLLLGEHNIALSNALSIVYILSEFYSFFLVKLFTSICRRLKSILVLGYARLKPLKELKRAYIDAFII